MSYDMGKKLTLLGFGGFLLLNIVNIVSNLIFPTGLGMISTVIGTLFTLAAAGGFAIMFLDRRNILDLIIGGLIGLNAVYNFAPALFIRYGANPTTALLSIIGFAGSLYLLAWAFKFKDKNMLVALLLGAAFLYPIAYVLLQTFVIGSSQIVTIPTWLNIINILGNLACNAIKAFAAYSEE